jgi:hypothetical protein
MLTSALSMIVLGQQPLLTFKSNFEPLGKVVERLASETGTPMIATGHLKNYPIYLNVSDVTLSDIMNRIAKVTDAGWVQKSSGWYLSSDQSDKIALERKGDSEVIRALEATIQADIKKPLTGKELEAKSKDIEQNPEKMGEFIQQMFSGMFTADEATLQLIRMIGAKDLSTIIDGRRVVLSSQPNLMQGQLSVKAYNEISAFIKREAKKPTPKPNTPASSAKVKVVGQGQEDIDMDGFDFGDILGGGGKIKRPDLVNQIGIVQAAFQIASRTSLTVNLSVFAKSGEIIYSKLVQLPIVNPDASKEVPNGQRKVIFSPLSQGYAKALEDGANIDPMASAMLKGSGDMMGMFGAIFSSSAAGPKQSTPPNAEVMEALSDPSKFEPLTFLFSPTLDELSKDGRDVIALPSDEIFTTLNKIAQQGSVTVEKVLAEVDKTVSQKVSDDGTWTIIQASSQLELQSAHCNRTALSNLIKSGKSKGYVNLADCARFATAQGQARGSEILALPLVTAVFRTSDLGSISSLSSTGFDSLKLYASLSDFQKNALRNRQSVALAALTNPQREILARMVYNGAIPPMQTTADTPDPLGTLPEGGDGDDASAMMGLGLMMAGPMMSSLFGVNAGFLSERTNLLPNGIPVVGNVRMATLPMNSLVAIDSKNGMKSITNPELLAMKDIQIPGMPKNDRQFDRYQLAKQYNYFIVFKLGNGASYFTTLYDVEVDASRTYTKEQLPEKMQKRLQTPDWAKELGNMGIAKPINP